VSDDAEPAGIAAAVRAPQAAAVAGILFAVLLVAVILLVRSVVPATPADVGDWVASSGGRSRVALAMGLLPFAGIAFLWFIGVLRDHVGDREDKLFATVFLGSGLLFVGTLFVTGALTTALVALGGENAPSADIWRFNRRLVFLLMTGYALRMAAVFTIATTTMGARLRVFPRWLIVTGYVAGLLLLVTLQLVPWVEVVFPLWVLLVSVHILRAGFHRTRSSTVA
jgi:hypothetical protein